MTIRHPDFSLPNLEELKFRSQMVADSLELEPHSPQWELAAALWLQGVREGTEMMYRHTWQREVGA